MEAGTEPLGLMPEPFDLQAIAKSKGLDPHRPIPLWLIAREIAALGVEIKEEYAQDAIIYDASTSFGIPFISHPLYHALYFPHAESNKRYNEFIEAKIECLHRYADEGLDKLASFIWAHERPYRTDVLHKFFTEARYRFNDRPVSINNSIALDIVLEAWDTMLDKVCDGTLDDAKRRILRLARQVWTDSENITQNKRRWKSLFAWGPGEYWMEDEDRKQLQQWKQENRTLTVYRGECDDLGISWTLSKRVAQFFADRPLNDSTGEVYEATIEARSAYAYFTSRDEDEVIIKQRPANARRIK